MNKQTEVIDERQQQINCRAMANAGIFLGLCICASMIYKMVTADSMGWEFFAILGACVVVIISCRVMGDVEQPKDIMNRPLPVSDSKQDRRARKINYAIQSGLFALGFMVMDILLVGFGKSVVDYELATVFFSSLGKGMTIAVTAVIALVFSFVGSYIIDYLVGEHAVKKYNKMLAQLDAEDDEL